MDEIIEINEAITLLKENIILKDNLNNKFVYKKKRINIYSNNSSYTLSINDFLDLFKENKFVIYSDDDTTIDLEKDKEYYSFRHK